MSLVYFDKGTESLNYLLLFREKLDEVLRTIQPLPKAGSPMDIGRTVAFLASDKSAGFATGSDFVIDGGYTLSPNNRPPRK